MIRVGRPFTISQRHRSWPIFTRAYGRRPKETLNSNQGEFESSTVEASNGGPAEPEGQVAAQLRERRRLLHRMGKRSRLDIISHGLCSDVVSRLAPSLQRHVNCDIVDLNPGVGVWSAALHNQIQPRRHILVETDTDFYRPFLQPLLDQPDSRYQLVPCQRLDFKVFEQLVQGGFLTDHQKLEPGDPRLDLPYDSLLLVANLSQMVGKKYLGMQSNTILLRQLIVAIQNSSALQAYGRVRMLIWDIDKEKRTILPRTIVNRGRFAMEVEHCFANVFEVAGLDAGGGKNKRSREFELATSIKVTKDMMQRGVVTPPERKGEIQKEAETIIAGKEEIPSVLGRLVQRPWHAELEALEQAFQEGKVAADDTALSSEDAADDGTMKANVGHKNKSAKGRKPKNAPKRLAFLRCIATREAEIQANVLNAVNESNEASDTEPDAKPVAVDPLSTSTPLHSSTRYVHERTQIQTKIYLDERQAVQSDPPLLLWDRRHDEPLIVRGDDFEPDHAPMALLDFQPKSLSPHLRTSEGNTEVWRYLHRRLLDVLSRPVDEAIRSLAPGAFEALVPHMPSLRDHPDLRLLRVRSMTPHMMEELVQAWMTWPHRPSRRDILTTFGEEYWDWKDRIIKERRL